MTSDTDSARPDKFPDRPRRRESPDAGVILAEALSAAPDEVVEALGGAPVAVPSQAARRVIARPAGRREADAPGAAPAATKAVPGRAVNPLFDAPGKAALSAAVDIRRLRSALGSVATCMDAAADLYDLAIAGDAPAIRDAAAREGFDLDAAGAVVAEIRAFLDRHKPKSPSSAPAP